MLSSPALWYLVAFVIFVGLAIRPFVKKAKSAILAYQSDIERDFKEAEEVYQEAQAYFTEQERRMAQLKIETQQIHNRYKARLQEAQAMIKEAYLAKIEAKKNSTAMQIKAMQEECLFKQQNQVINLTIEVVQAYVRSKSTPETAFLLIQQNLKELKNLKI